MSDLYFNIIFKVKMVCRTVRIYYITLYNITWLYNNIRRVKHWSHFCHKNVISTIYNYKT